MAAGEMPFQGDTDAVVYDAILNRAPKPLSEVSPSAPAELGQIVEKALEKDRQLRYQSATDLKTDLLRLKRKLDSGQRHAAELSESKAGVAKLAEKSVAVLYFENLGGPKEDEYFRDGITEDIITELSKIEGLRVNQRSMVLQFRDQPLVASQVGQQLGVAYVLEGSLRRAGDRLRITAKLVETASGYAVWSERYDREMKDVFEVQDEIARKIAEALRIKLSRQEQEALASKPTDNPQAYDLYLRGRSYARRLTRQDLEFALQMLENAVSQDPNFALAYAAIANVCAYYHAHYAREDAWMQRARAAAEKAMTLHPGLPEVMVAQAWILYAKGQYDEMVVILRNVIARKSDCEGAYYLLLRGLYASGKYQDVADIAERAIEASGTDYNVYVPVMNSLGALGKKDAENNLRQRVIQALEAQLREIPEDARARILLGAYYAEDGRVDDAMREANLAMTLRPNEAMVLYNAACTFCTIQKKAEALDAIAKAWRAGFRDADWARRDPTLGLIHDEPEFQKLYPEKAAGG
jgi:non-specific serine/threonine protein kinase